MRVCVVVIVICLYVTGESTVTQWYHILSILFNKLDIKLENVQWSFFFSPLKKVSFYFCRRCINAETCKGIFFTSVIKFMCWIHDLCSQIFWHFLLENIFVLVKILDLVNHGQRRPKQSGSLVPLGRQRTEKLSFSSFIPSRHLKDTLSDCVTVLKFISDQI